MLSCTENKSTILETPFVTVVKLVSAEQSLAFEEAIPVSYTHLTLPTIA